MAKTSWLKDCNICRVGLADAIDALKAKGSSENAACKELAKETESLGWSAESLKGMYRWATGKVKKKACDSHTKKDKKKARLNDYQKFVKKESKKDKYQDMRGSQRMTAISIEWDSYKKKLSKRVEKVHKKRAKRK